MHVIADENTIKYGGSRVRSSFFGIFEINVEDRVVAIVMRLVCSAVSSTSFGCFRRMDIYITARTIRNSPLHTYFGYLSSHHNPSYPGI